jgi:hypothetical protein
MTLTEKKLKEFFPTDNRFIFYVAKRYGMSLHTDDIVNDARYHSIVNLTRYLKKYGWDFESEGEIVSAVMYSIRYGILHAYGEYKKLNERNLDIRLASDFVFDDGDGLYTTYTKNLAVEDDEQGGLVFLYKNAVEHTLTELERKVLDMMIDGFNLVEIEKCLELKEGQAYLAKKRIQTRFKKAIKLENRNEKQQEFTSATYEKQVQKNLQFIREDNWYRSIIEDEKKRGRYIKAMSFLHPEKEVQYEVSNDGLVSR